MRRLNRNRGEVRVPKAGWVRFRWSRAVPADVKSFRVTRDRAGRWHVAFAVIPEPVAGPGTGAVVGIDRGVKVAAALSTGEMLHRPGLTPARPPAPRRLQRRLARAGAGRPAREGQDRDRAAESTRDDRRRDWGEKTSTDLARRFDVIRVEDLNIKAMTRSARGTVEAPGRNVPRRPA